MKVIYLDLLTEILNRAYERFETILCDLTTYEANVFPFQADGPNIKSVTWLTWHTSRELDLQISALAQTKPIYFSERWEEKFPFVVGEEEDGWNHTHSQAKEIMSLDNKTTLSYLRHAMDLAISYLETLSPEHLNDIIDTSWTPEVTRAIRLTSIIDDAVMHSGQAVYTHRLIKNKM